MPEIVWAAVIGLGIGTGLMVTAVVLRELLRFTDRGKDNDKKE
jgi:hypothetical protein